MKISLNWIQDYVKIPKDLTPEELGKQFTLKTAEVEEIENQSEVFDKIIVGQILEIHPHPDATKLQVTKTTIGSETLQIVCGANNIKEGMFVAVALVGAKVRWHGEGDLITLTPAKIRGVESAGMICAAEEIGLPKQTFAEGVVGIIDLTPMNPKVGQNLADLLEKNDTILTVDNKSLTHRPDLWGHYGIAREISAITKQPLKPLEAKVAYPTKGKSVEVKVEEPELCPAYCAVQINNIKVEPSPQWLKTRLEAVGYRSINNIVDATNYIMAELGQPLHAFDSKQIEGGIIVRTSSPEETVTTLDGQKRKLPGNALLITDHKRAVAIAGIMGAENSEITPETTSIILESANFNAPNVRKTSVKLNLRTEAVQRFEKSLDPNLALLALDHITALILKLCPQAEISGPKTEVINFKNQKREIAVNVPKLFTKLGKELPIKEVTDLLESIGFTINSQTKDSLKILVPDFRPLKDIEIEDDLVEEIARLHGYENIEAVLPELPIHMPRENRERKLKNQLRELLSHGLGFDEVTNYSFYSKQDAQKLQIPEELHLTITNNLSAEQTHLRVSMVPNLLKNVFENNKYFSDFNIYEIGHTYEDLQEYFPLEKKKITGVVVKPAKTSESVFLEAKGALEQILEQFRIPGLEARAGEISCPYAHPKRYLGYYLKKNGEELARVYELHPFTARNYDLQNLAISIFEINFSLLCSLPQTEVKYKPIPKFPGISIDISVLMDEKTQVGPVITTIKALSKEYIKGVTLSDLYTGKNIPEGKKSLTFSIELRSDEKTLTDEDMKTVQQSIFQKLQTLGGEIRGL